MSLLSSRRAAPALLLGALFILASCGGGGGTGSTSIPTEANLAQSEFSPDSGTVKLSWAQVSQSVPGTSEYDSWTLVNTGTTSSGQLATNVSGPGFSFLSDGCGGMTLLPHTSCSVTVQSPTSQIGASGTLMASATNLSGSATAFLTVGPKAVLTLRPGKLAGAATSGATLYNLGFGAVTAGTTKTNKFTVANSGAQASGTLTLKFAKITPQYSLSSDTCSATSLSAGGTCTFKLSFTSPTGCTSGTTFSKNLNIFEGSATDVTLSAKGSCL